jgi:uroporphyrinogen decarboxylase
MQINMKEWKRSMIAAADVAALPIMSYPGLELTGLAIADVVDNGENQTACVESLARKYPAAAAVAMMDLSREAEAFGAEIHFADDNVPSVAKNCIDSQESVQALEIPAVGSKRTKAALESAEQLARRISDRPVFAMQIGPFSLAADLLGLTSTMVQIMRQPALIHLLLEKATQFSIDYAKAFKEAGVNGVIVADMSAGLLSPKHCDEFSSAYIRRLVSAVQDENFMVILHNCGNTKKLVPSMVTTGADGLHFGNAVRMADILPQIPTDLLACGNIEPGGLFRTGKTEQMEESVRLLLQEMHEYPNFVLSSGCDLPLLTPLANIDAFFRTLTEHNTQLH